MVISYCSQIKNRFYQFKQTFHHNINHIKNNPNTEWIIVDCDSQDGLYEYMLKFGIMDRIHYYKTLNYYDYSIPVAKNLAARLSSGDYIFNLDIDNYIGDATQQIYSAGCGVYCNIFKQGVYGRIGCSRTIFNRIGGYDESFLPAGKHDMDLIARCQLINYTFKHIPCVIKPILNSKIETIINTNSNMNWETMNYLNSKKMQYNIQNNIYCPNKKFTSCNLEYNFTEKRTLSEEIK